MTRQTIISKTVEAINQLPPDKASEISDFAEFLLKKYDEQVMIAGIETLVSQGQAFEFLREEEVEYSVNDLKIVFDAQR